MKFKFLTLTLLALALNCQAAEEIQRYRTSLSLQELQSNPQFAKLDKEIQTLKNNIYVAEESLPDIKDTIITYGVVQADGTIRYVEEHQDNVVAYYQAQLKKDKEALTQKRKERAALILQLDPKCEFKKSVEKMLSENFRFRDLNRQIMSLNKNTRLINQYLATNPAAQSEKFEEMLNESKVSLAALQEEKEAIVSSYNQITNK